MIRRCRDLVMPTKVGIHVFPCSDQQRRGSWAGACPRAGLRPDPWARHDGESGATAAAKRASGILRLSRQILCKAGSVIVNLLQRVDASIEPAKNRRIAARRRTSSANPPPRRGPAYGRRETSYAHPRRQSPTKRELAPNDEVTQATIAELLRQHTLRIADSADPIDALAHAIKLVIESDADPYHLIGVLAEGAAETITQCIPSERRRDTTMALLQLMLDRLQLGRTQ
jgi:hypothetical protein